LAVVSVLANSDLYHLFLRMHACTNMPARTTAFLLCRARAWPWWKVGDYYYGSDSRDLRACCAVSSPARSCLYFQSRRHLARRWQGIFPLTLLTTALRRAAAHENAQKTPDNFLVTVGY
jgi:hypothetical protein